MLNITNKSNNCFTFLFRGIEYGKRSAIRWYRSPGVTGYHRRVTCLSKIKVITACECMYDCKWIFVRSGILRAFGPKKHCCRNDFLANFIVIRSLAVMLLHLLWPILKNHSHKVTYEFIFLNNHWLFAQYTDTKTSMRNNVTCYILAEGDKNIRKKGKINK